MVRRNTTTFFAIGSRVQLRSWAAGDGRLEGELISIGRKYVAVRLDSGGIVRNLHPSAVVRPGSQLFPF